MSFFTLYIGWGQATTDLQIDNIVIIGESAPYEFCEGEIPSFEIQFSLKAGSTTLTLTSTSTLEFTAIGSGGNVLTKTVTGVTSFGTGATSLSPAASDYFRWPTVGTEIIQLSNDGVTDIIFKIFINSAVYSDPDSPDSAVSSLTVNVNTNPPKVGITTSEGNFDVGKRIDICDGIDITLFADAGYTDYEFLRKPDGLINFSSMGKSSSRSILLTNINAGGEEIKVRTYNGECLTDSFTYYVDVVTGTTVNLNSSMTGNTSCEGENITFTALGSGGWYEFLVFSGISTSTVQSSTAQTWSSTTLNHSNRVTVRNYTTSATSCYSEAAVTIELNSFSNISNISGDQSICSGNAPGLLGSITESVADRLGDGATVNYYWEKNEGAGWSLLGASNSSTFQPGVLTTTTAYRRVLSSKYNTKTCLDISDTVTVTVTSGPSITNFELSSSTNNTICNDDEAVFEVTSTGVSTPSYRFFHNLNPIGTLIVGGSTASITVSSTIELDDMDEIQVRVYGNNDGTGCSVSSTIVLRVNEFDATLNEISGDQVVCNDDVITAISDQTSPTAPGNITTRWYSSPSGMVTPSWTLMATNVPSFTPLSLSGDTDFRREIESELNGIYCYNYSNVITKSEVAITSDLASYDLTLNPINELICLGDTILFDAGASTGSSGYQYHYNGTPLGVFSANTTTTHTGFSDGDTFSVTVAENSDGTGCTATTTLTIRVNTFTGSHSLSTSQTICLGDDPVLINVTSTPTPTILGSVATYQWERQEFGSLTWNSIPGGVAQLPTYDPPLGSVTQTTSFRRVISYTNSTTTCDLPQNLSESSVHVIYVNAHPGGSLVASTASICTGDSVTFSASGPAGANYTFYVGATIAQGKSGTSTYTSSSLLNGQIVSVVIEDTTGSGCEFTPSGITMAVSNIPAAGISSTDLTNGTICNDYLPVFTATPATGMTYQFYIASIPVASGAVSGNQLLTSKVTYTLQDGDVIGVVASNANGCSSSASLTLSVNDFSGSDTITTTTTEYCSGGDPVFITGLNSSAAANGGTISYRWETRTSSPVVSGWEPLNIPPATLINLDPPPLADGTHHFRRVTINEYNSLKCDAPASNVVTITIGAGSAPTLTVTMTNTVTSAQVSNQTICSGEGINIDAGASSGDGYEFYLNDAPVQLVTNISNFTFLGLSDQDRLQVRVFENADGTGCFSDYTATIRVNTLTGNNSIDSNSQTVCYEGDPQLISSVSSPSHLLTGGIIRYQWQKRVQGSLEWNDISGANIESYNPPSGQLTSTTEFRRLATPEFNGLSCTGTSSPSHVSNIALVNVVSSFTSSLTSNPNPAEICAGDTVIFQASAVGSATYEFFVDGTSQGTASTTRSIQLNPTNGQQVTVEVTTGSCSILSDPINVIVNPDPIPVLTAVGVVNDVICENEAPIIIATPTGNYSYSFFVNDLPAPGAAVTTNSLDLSLLPLITDPIKIDVTIIDNVSGCSNTTSTANGSSLVLVTNSIGNSNEITSATVSYCSGSDPIAINPLNNPTTIAGGTINYFWETRTPSLSTSWTLINNANADSFDPQASIGDGVHEFRRLITATVSNVTCTPTDTLYYSNTVTITIGGTAGTSPPVTISSNISGGGNIICPGEDVIFTATSNASATWYEFFVRNQSKGVTASDTLDTSLATVTLVDGDEIRVRVYSGAATGTGCFNDATMIIRVNSMSNNNIISYIGPDPICAGIDPEPAIQGISNPISDLATDGGRIEYEWELDEGLGWQPILNSDSETFNPPVLTVTTAYRRLAKSLFSGSECILPTNIHISNVVTITVDAGPTPIANLTTGLASDTLCSSTDSITLDASLSSNANSYLFYHNGNPILSHTVTDSSFTSTATINDGDTFTVRTFAGNNRDGCFDDTTVTISVNAITGTNEIGPATQNLCPGESPSMINSLQLPSSSGTVSYTWEIRPASTGVWGTILGETSATLTPTLDGNSSAYRRTYISTLNEVPCSIYSNIVTITLDSNTAASATLTSNKPSHTICATETGTIEFTAANDAAASRYEFYVNGTLEQTDATSRTFEVARADLSNGTTVTLRVYNNSSLGCYDEDEVIVRINDIDSGTISGTQSVCSDSTNPIILSSLTAGSINGVAPVNGQYQWQYSTDNINWTNIILNGNNASYVVQFNPSHPTRYYRRNVEATLNTVPCSGSTPSVKITVLPAPSPQLWSNVGVYSTNITVCSDENLFFKGEGGQSFEFLVRGVVEHTTDADSGLSTAFFNPNALGVTINDGDQVSVIAYDKPLIGGVVDPAACSGTSSDVMVVISSTPTATLTTDKLNNIICDDEPFTLTATAGGLTGATYQFIINTITVQTVTTTVAEASASFSPPTPYTSSMTIKVLVTTPQGCTTSATIIATENPITAGTISGTQTICSGNIPAEITSLTTPTISATATATYQWHSSTDNFV
ncbi:MAG: hypothetical protein HOH47_05990, partial [Flavobacteriaceae bacterium]|nr:hypothetical protein [Flavobacteriaceae bacterium]